MSGKRHEQKHRPIGLRLRADLLDEANAQAKRLDRSLSWVVAQAWKVARERVRAMPVAPRLPR